MRFLPRIFLLNTSAISFEIFTELNEFNKFCCENRTANCSFLRGGNYLSFK